VCYLDKGGTQRAAQIFAEAYKQIGHDSRILSLYGLGSRSDEIIKEGIRVWYKNSDENLKEIKIWSPDIIHIHSSGPKEGDVNRILDALQNKNVKVVEQSVFSIPSPWEKRIDFSFQLSNWALWLYVMRGGDKSKAVIVSIPVNCKNFYHKNPAEIKKFRDTYHIPDDAFVIGRIGQSAYVKWSAMLIYVFNKLAKIHSNVYMVVVNPPPNIVKEIEQSPFNGRIVVIPKIYGDDALSVAYSSFDLMVHIAEQGESFGYVLVESILCEIPVVTLSTPWADNSQCEVVGNLKGGYVVNRQSGIIAAIEDYIRDKGVRNLKKGYENVCRNYDHIKLANEAIHYASYGNDGAENEFNVIRNKIDAILHDTFDKPDALTISLMRTNILWLRRLTLYTFPMRILIPRVFRRVFKK
jgi:glycosyltransferase involved in cell wall biosynthesis